MKKHKIKTQNSNKYYLSLIFAFISLAQSFSWANLTAEKINNLEVVKCTLFSGRFDPVDQLILFPNFETQSNNKIYRVQTDDDPVLDRFDIITATEKNRRCNLEIDSIKGKILLTLPLDYNHKRDYPNASNKNNVNDKQISAKYGAGLFNSNGYCEVIKFINPNKEPEAFDSKNSTPIKVVNEKNGKQTIEEETFYYKTTDLNYITVLRSFYGEKTPDCNVKLQESKQKIKLLPLEQHERLHYSQGHDDDGGVS